MELNHFSHDHPLILSEEEYCAFTDLDNILCEICRAPLVGLCYCCHKCTYALHKWCADLPLHMQNEFHPQHPLVLSREVPSDSVCDDCSKNIIGETYAYYDYPFCFSDKLKEKKQSIGEALNGDRLVFSPYKLDFLVEKKSEVACSRKLSREEVSKFRLAIAQDYYIQFYYDDLPVWVYIGDAERTYKGKPNGNKYLLYTHIWFDIYYNNDQVIDIYAHTNLEFSVDITKDKEVEVEFVYDVKWKGTDISFEKRMDLHDKSALFPNHLRNHLSFIIDSCWPILILLVSLVQIYKQKLRKDINMYADFEEFGENQEETGWKSLHGDVFRPPIHKSLFAALVGSGTQLVVLMFLIVMLGVFGIFHPYSRGALITTIVFGYAITSGIAGYTTSSLYSQFEGTEQVKNLLLTTFIFIGPIFVIFCVLNTVAMTYQVTLALPLQAIVALFCIWAFIGVPSLFLGGYFMTYRGLKSQAPYRTYKIPREVPTWRWYRRIFPYMGLGGLMLFCSICNELNYVLATVWGYTIYTTYAFLLISSIGLLVLASLVGVLYTFIHLAAEDHRWWWRPFLNCGSSSFFMFGYCVYYFFWRSQMSGVLQTTFFLGYMACVCYGFFLMMGAVGFYSSLLFVRHIYGAIKCD